VLATLGVAAVVWAASGGAAGPDRVLNDTLDLLAWSKPSTAFHDELAWLRVGVGAFTVIALVVGGRLFFRPLAPPRELPEPHVRDAVDELVRAHGSDTLAFFKLRRDMHYLVSSDRRAFVGYRVEGGVLLAAGDPVGPMDALPDLIRDLFAFAEVRGLRVAVLAASNRLLPLWQQAGLRSLYIGDEAILETACFSLEGRAIRKIRQAVTRLEKAGYSASAAELGSLDGWSASPPSGAAAPPSAASRWRWTRSRARTRPTASSSSHVTRPARSAGSSTSSRPSAAPRCRSRSCVVTTGLRTG